MTASEMPWTNRLEWEFIGKPYSLPGRMSSYSQIRFATVEISLSAIFVTLGSPNFRRKQCIRCWCPWKPAYKESIMF